VTLIVGQLGNGIQGDLIVIFITDFELDRSATAQSDLHTCQMELSVSILRKIFEDDAAGQGVQIVGCLATAFLLVNAGVWLLVNQ
jgi:hypothetical protein